MKIVGVDLECSGAQPKANINTENEKSFSAHYWNLWHVINMWSDSIKIMIIKPWLTTIIHPLLVSAITGWRGLIPAGSEERGLTFGRLTTTGGRNETTWSPEGDQELITAPTWTPSRQAPEPLVHLLSPRMLLGSVGVWSSSLFLDSGTCHAWRVRHTRGWRFNPHFKGMSTGSRSHLLWV